MCPTPIPELPCLHVELDLSCACALHCDCSSRLQVNASEQRPVRLIRKRYARTGSASGEQVPLGAQAGYAVPSTQSGQCAQGVQGGQSDQCAHALRPSAQPRARATFRYDGLYTVHARRRETAHDAGAATQPAKCNAECA
eukprot:3067475-Pleurochrysis_carterae.AAC.1